MALQGPTRARLYVLLIVIAAITAVGLAVGFRNRHSAPTATAPNANQNGPATVSLSESPTVSPDASPVPQDSPNSSPTPLPVQSPAPSQPVETPAGQPSPSSAAPDSSFVGTLKLIIPVAGVKPDQLIDTFTASRSEGRVHDAIDIPAAAGTSVVAASDGQIVKLFQSERGGTTIYQLSPDKKLIFYYAHLQGYAAGLVEGKFVKQGEVIAYVGDTGNAGAGNYHLHFSISVVSDPKRYWEGTNINPYPLLRK